MSSDTLPVVIIGGGWAGLAAAIKLCKAGINVELFESARQTGGRARCAPFGDNKVDNGQHLMVGAYHCMQELLSDIGLQTEKLYARFPVDMRLHDSKGNIRRIASAPLPIPFNLLAGILKSKGIRLSEHLSVVRFLLRQRKHNFQLEQDIPVSELIAEQPANIREALWEPLCIAALNTPADKASANIFLRVLQDSFMHNSRDSDFLIPVTDLGNTFPQPAVDFIERHGGKVHFAERVTGINIQNGTAVHITTGNRRIRARDVIVATSHHQAEHLLGEHELLAGIASNLQKIQTQPICTVYLRYPPDTRLDFPMQGLLGTTSQWVFDRRICGQPGLMAIVISADGEHMQLDKQQLLQLVTEEMASCFPHWPRPGESLVIREKRATFSADVGVDSLRPACDTPVQNLWLAGDYTATGYPATLEGAMRSGVQCAQLILAKQENKHV